MDAAVLAAASALSFDGCRSCESGKCSCTVAQWQSVCMVSRLRTTSGRIDVACDKDGSAALNCSMRLSRAMKRDWKPGASVGCYRIISERSTSTEAVCLLTWVPMGGNLR